MSLVCDLSCPGVAAVLVYLMAGIAVVLILTLVPVFNPSVLVTTNSLPAGGAPTAIDTFKPECPVQFAV